MHVTEEESLEIEPCRLKDVAYDWITMLKDGKGENATPMSWQVFLNTFLERIFPYEVREAKVKEFINLRQGSMIGKE